ncbi:acyltransferase [Vibrio sp. 070316B]|uniref:acyltransferase n=1 Tax=Vibrio sp. 070316B TaxID=2607608 RepID=UPI001C0FBAE7
MLKKILNYIFNDNVFYLVALVDRWASFRIRKAKGRIELKKIKNKGENCKIHGEVTIAYPDKIKMSENVRIGYGCHFFCMGGLNIGANTQISRNVLIYTANHNIDGTAIPYDDKYILKPVTIGKSVWIGMNVTISPGVNIGDGAVIGMGTVVSKDVPKGAIVVGAAQRVIKHRDLKDFYDKDKNRRYFSEIWPDN